MVASLTSAALVGIEAEPVHVEASASEEGEPRIVLVGLPDVAVKESIDRIFSALAQCGFRPTRTRTTINLAPGDLRKEGPLYDLPIAIALLSATGQIETPRLSDFLIAGELGLSGETRPIRGALAIARLAARLGKRAVLLPPHSAEEAALVPGIAVYRVDSLPSACRLLAGSEVAIPLVRTLPDVDGTVPPGLDFSELKGQLALRRAVEVAVAGAHPLLLVGPPGSGKSMAAKRIAPLLPPPDADELLEILSIHSLAGRSVLGSGSWKQGRPFRAPHHTISESALLGGGLIPGPGEISLAHHGVLFLDELPEFKRSVLEVLRQPLEEGQVTISRSRGKVTFPSAFLLVAAMNPCPCGHWGDRRRRCRCSPTQVESYRRRISGPLLDRIDLHVEAPALAIADLRSEAPAEATEPIRARVQAARARQRERLAGTGAAVNARMSQAQIRRHCRIEPALADLLQQAMEKLALSARAYDRVLKVARTISDLAAAERIEAPHLLEAIQYRTLDRALAV